MLTIIEYDPAERVIWARRLDADATSEVGAIPWRASTAEIRAWADENWAAPDDYGSYRDVPVRFTD